MKNNNFVAIGTKPFSLVEKNKINEIFKNYKIKPIGLINSILAYQFDIRINLFMPSNNHQKKYNQLLFGEPAKNLALYLFIFKNYDINGDISFSFKFELRGDVRYKFKRNWLYNKTLKVYYDYDNNFNDLCKIIIEKFKNDFELYVK